MWTETIRMERGYFERSELETSFVTSWFSALPSIRRARCEPGLKRAQSVRSLYHRVGGGVWLTRASVVGGREALTAEHPSYFSHARADPLLAVPMRPTTGVVLTIECGRYTKVSIVKHL